MQKYAKYMNDTSKALMVMDSNDADMARAWGMELMDVEQGYDGVWYKTSELPVKPDGWKSPEEIVKEQAEIEAQRLPDVEDAAIDLAAYIAELDERIKALEGK